MGVLCFALEAAPLWGPLKLTITNRSVNSRGDGKGGWGGAVRLSIVNFPFLRWRQV